MRGRARGKLGTCNQMLRMPQMPKGGLFCLFRLASHIRVLSKSGEKPALLSKTTLHRQTGISRKPGFPRVSPRMPALDYNKKAWPPTSLYKLTGRPAHDGLAQVDYSASGRRSGALQRGSGPIICEPGLEDCFDAAASSLAVRQRIRAAGWAVSVIGSLLRACGVRLCSDRCAWDAGRRFLSCGG